MFGVSDECRDCGLWACNLSHVAAFKHGAFVATTSSSVVITEVSCSTFIV